MKKTLLYFFMFLALTTGAYAGTTTTNGYQYLPDYGAYGTDEHDAWIAADQVADTQIEANKDAAALNTTHTAGDGSDHADVATNTTHSSDNTQAHTDYLLNSGSDTMGGTLTADGITIGQGEMFTAGTNTLVHNGSTWVLDDDAVVSEENYGVGWNGSLEVPTKDDVFDQMEIVSGLGSASSLTDLSDVSTATATAGRLLIADGTSFQSIAMSNDCTITSAGVISCSASATSLTGLTDVTSATATAGRLLIADGTDFESVAVSGDITISSAGATTIGANKVGTSEIDLAIVPTWTAVHTFTVDIIVPEENYGVAWNGSLEAPTKDDVFDQIEIVSGLAAASSLSDLSDVTTATAIAGRLLIADGTDFESISMSGDCTITSAGVTSCAGGSFITTTNTTTNSPGTLATDDFVFGSDSPNYDGDADHLHRIVFDKSEGSFRAGRALTTQWDEANRGNQSAGFGRSNTASGDYSFAAGNNNIASSEASTAFGTGNTASGLESVASGHASTASGILSNASGNATTATGNFSTASNLVTTAQAYASFVIGRYNTISGTTDSWVATEPLFVVGNGANAGAPANAFAVNKDGTTFIGGTTTIDGDLIVTGSFGGAANSLTGLSDVTTATATAGRLLVADGTDFESISMSGDCTMDSAGVITCTGAGSLTGLSDVTTATATSGYLLVADGTDFESVAMSGDITILSSGVTILDVASDRTWTGVHTFAESVTIEKGDTKLDVNTFVVDISEDYVGINTLIPQDKFDIRYSASANIMTFTSTLGTATGWIMYNTEGEPAYVYPNAAQNGITVSATRP